MIDILYTSNNNQISSIFKSSDSHMQPQQ